MKTKIIACTIAVLLGCYFAGAQGTSFTYQGRLNDGGSPANGNYDLTFTLFGASSGGSAIAGPRTNSPTAVANGVFTVRLDFGAGAFPGADRWLEIGVRTNGGGAFNTLSGRQQITSTPYALQSANAGSAASVSGPVSAAQLTGTIPAANIGAGSITSIMMADGSIHSNHLASGSVHSNALVIGSIHSNHLAAGSIHSNALALGSVTALALADGAIHSNHLAAGSVHSNALVIGSIHSNHLAIGSIHSNHLALASIHSNHLAAGSIHSNALAFGSVTAFALADGAIHSNHVATGSIHSNALVIGSIHSNHLAAGSVHSNALALGSVTAFALADDSIHSNHIAAGSVHSNALVIGSIHSNHLAIGSIHSNHLALASIHSNHLAAGSVHSNALALGSVTAFALADDAIHSNHIAAGSIHSNALVIGSIHSNHLAAGSVHSNALALGSVTAFALADGAIHSNHLAAGSIHSNALAVGSVTAFALADDSIHSNHLAVGSIHSNALALGSVTAFALADGTIHSNHIAVGSIHSNALVIGAIHSNHIAVGAVSADKLIASRTGSFSATIANPNVSFFDYFGVAVAALGTDKVLVGAYLDSTAWDSGGAAYLLTAGGTLQRTFLSPNPQNQEHFGFAVASMGVDKVLIGADANDTGAQDAGAAYLFSTNGTVITTFTNPTPAASDFFGYSVAAVGTDKVLIGAYADHFGANLGGAAYLFTTNRTLLTTFTNPTPANGDRFGIAVAAVGTDKVLIGADRDDSGGASDVGVAYLFNINGTLLATLANPTPGGSDFFGASVTAVGSDKVLIGAPGDSSAGNAGGAAYLFNTSGALLTTLPNPTPASGDQFGISVAAADANNLIIGAASDDGDATDAGAVYLFSADGTLLSTFHNPSPANGDGFGNAVAAVGSDKVLIGAWQDDAGATDSGLAYVWTLESYTPGLVADAVKPGSITTSRLDDGAVTLEKLDSTIGVWTRAGNDVYRPAGGNVGIGTATPQHTLHVQGNNSQLRLHDSFRGNFWHIYTENHPNALISGNLLFFPGPSGVYGYIQKSSGSYFSSSDVRLKTDIHRLGNVLDRVLQLRPVSYRFKSAPESVRPTLGLIAQEVEPLFPEVVDEHNDLKSLSYSEMVPVTVRAIQELNDKVQNKNGESGAKIRKLEDQLKRLDTENADLKARLEKLEALLGKRLERASN